MNEIIINKIEEARELFKELKKQYKFYNELKGDLKNTAYYASQKKVEELIEITIKINRELLKTKKITATSYKESFIKLEILGIEKTKCEIYSDFAIFRNRLAHEYLTITEDETINEIKDVIKYYPEYLKEIINFI